MAMRLIEIYLSRGVKTQTIYLLIYDNQINLLILLGRPHAGTLQENA